MIFIARQFQEKRQEQNVDFYMTPVDLSKHLTQSVVRDFENVWQRSTAAVPRWMLSQVKNDDGFSAQFPVIS